ncbi:hypothetical protein COCVIDRAFT_113081, partial [Bipolaris victoriae FI3]
LTQLTELIDFLGIQDEDLYNIEETSIQISILKRQALYMQHGRNVLIPTSNNQATIILVECISAPSSKIAPAIIVDGTSILDY